MSEFVLLIPPQIDMEQVYKLELELSEIEGVEANVPGGERNVLELIQMGVEITGTLISTGVGIQLAAEKLEVFLDKAFKRKSKQAESDKEVEDHGDKLDTGSYKMTIVNRQGEEVEIQNLDRQGLEEVLKKIIPEE